MESMIIHAVESLGEPVGRLWQKLQADHIAGPFYVASALSSTPLPIYDWVIDHARSFPNWPQVKFVLMDDQTEGAKAPYQYIATDDPASYEGFAHKHLFNPLNARTGTILPVLKPKLSDMNSFNPRIDLLILALGVKGNYANVMPGTAETVGWHIAHLLPEFSQSHTQPGSQSYENARFREFGMSLGPQQILAAKNIVVIISGAKKRNLTEQLLSNQEFDPEFPLSIIHHKKVTDRVQIFIQTDVGITR